MIAQVEGRRHKVPFMRCRVIRSVTDISCPSDFVGAICAQQRKPPIQAVHQRFYVAPGLDLQSTFVCVLRDFACAKDEVFHMEWFLIHVLSPLLLPIFVLAVLCFVCDVKPDTFIKLYLDILQKCFEVTIRLLWQVLVKVWEVLVCVLICLSSGIPDCGKSPKKKVANRRRLTSETIDKSSD